MARVMCLLVASLGVVAPQQFRVQYGGTSPHPMSLTSTTDIIMFTGDDVCGAPVEREIVPLCAVSVVAPGAYSGNYIIQRAGVGEVTFLLTDVCHGVVKYRCLGVTAQQAPCSATEEDEWRTHEAALCMRTWATLAVAMTYTVMACLLVLQVYMHMRIYGYRHDMPLRHRRGQGGS